MASQMFYIPRTIHGFGSREVNSDTCETTHIWAAAATPAGLAFCTKFIYIYIFMYTDTRV